MIPINAQFEFGFTCRENWDGMNGSDSVRTCASCNRNVYNLDGLTDVQLSHLVQENGGKLCGRKRIAAKPKTRNLGKLLRLSVFLLSMFLLEIRKGMAQVRISEKGEIYPDNEKSPQKEYVISGVVQDSENGLPLEFATIELLDAEERTIAGTYTDGDGKYKITLPNNSLNYKIRVRSIGYQNQVLLVEGHDGLHCLKKLDIDVIRCKSEIIIVGAIISRPEIIPIRRSVRINEIGTTTTYRSEAIERYNLGRH